MSPVGKSTVMCQVGGAVECPYNTDSGVWVLSERYTRFLNFNYSGICQLNPNEETGEVDSS